MTAVKDRGRAMGRPNVPIAIIALFALAGLLCVREGGAQVLTYAGSFTAKTGAPANQDVTGVPFQPKAVVFFWTTQTTATFSNNAEAGYGFAAGAGLERVVVYAVGHNVAAPGNSKRFQSTTRSVAFFTQAGTVDGQAHFVQFNVDGFRLQWDAFPSVGYLVHYMAIGGSHITNQTVNEFTLSACADQTAPVCNDGAGEQEDIINTGFEPDFLMFLSVDSNTAGASVSDGRISIGFAGLSGGALTQAAISTAARASGATNITTSRQIEGRALLEKNHALFGDTLEAEVTTMLGNGFRINKYIHTTGTETRVHYLALRGGQYKMGGLTKPTVAAPYTDPQAQNTVGFNPRGLFFFSRVLDPGTGAAEIGRIAFGAADSQGPFNEEATFYEDHLDSPTDDQGQRATPPFDNTFARQGNSSTAAILMAQAGDCYPLIDPPPNALTTLADCQNGPDAGGVRITGQANVASLDPDGFTLDWTTNELVNLSALTNEDEARVVYVALGNEPPTVYYRSIGTAADYSVGSVTVVNGSTAVSGVGGTQWLTNNRGTGDRININGTDYMVLGPVTEDTLTLSTPFVGIGGTYPYVLARQFPSLQAWEDCVSFTTPCTYFPVASNNLVTDDRSEVGVAYKETVFSGVTIDGSVTDATHTIALTATPENWHKGIAGAGVRLNNGANGNSAVRVFDDFVRVEFLEIFGGSGSASGIEVNNISGGVGANGILLRNNLVHNVPGNGLALFDGDQVTDAYNNIVYSAFEGIRVLGGFQIWTRIRLLNNTLYNNTSNGINSSEAGFSGSLTLDNNIAATNPNGDFVLAGPPNASSASNLSTDASAAAASPFNLGLSNMDVDASIQFVNRFGGDLHIGPFSVARNQALDRSSIFTTDIDGAARFPGSFSWDIGADEQGATTLVTLRSFEAQGFDGSVDLEWETASELDNLGFHLYRATSEGGPYECITTSVIPGLGSSPVGARYSYRDLGLENGLTYFYKIEDVETTGGTTLHGPVSATPLAGVVLTESPPEDAAVLAYGDPRATDLRIVSRSPRELVLELSTGGFEAVPLEDGSVRLRLPGFLEEGEPGSPAVPFKRTWVDGVAGRKVRLISASAEDVEVFSSLRPQAASVPTVIASARGTVRAGRAPSRESARFRGRGFYPENWARLVSEGYQGESKKALVELSPLRWDRERAELVLAKKLTLRLAFAGSDVRRREGAGPRRATTVRRLVTRDRGLHAVRFEEVWGKSRSGISSSDLRLSRGGGPVAYHLAPRASRFGPGSVLYFWSEGPSSNPYGNESVFELERAPGGRTMEVVDGSPAGTPLPFYWHRVEREENRYYQAALLEAPDLWLWDVLVAPVTKSFGFEVKELVSTLEPARLVLDLQGVSDFPESPDHHLRVSVNGTPVAESSFDGKLPLSIEAELPSGVLREGENELTLENIGDTEAEYSMVMLDRFAVTYPRGLSADDGILEGSFPEAGTAEVTGAGALPLILESPGPRWVRGAVAAESTVRFGVEAGRRYTVVHADAVRKPELLVSPRASLRNPRRRADYLLVAPEAFLDVAKPLLELRARQGLRTLAVPIEQVYSEFGFGERRPEALNDFLAYAYHEYRKPAPRYVLLLGDATYDFKDYLATGVKNQVPPAMVKTSYLWTASDLAYAAVNGEDALPDLAIGRLPAGSRDEARAMIEKIVAYERGGLSPARGPVVLVADNPDSAGDFERDADEISAGVLASRNPERIDLGRLGVEATRTAIEDAFDGGLSIMSYLGHGGIHLWAHEDIFNGSEVTSLGPQAEQPLVLTLNCLNGYFHFPYFNSLAEELVKAPGKGAIAAFSPSGLSLNDAARIFHEALLEEIASGKHPRLGDAVLAAQSAYADSGAFPELLTIYHLLGDPALSLR